MRLPALALLVSGIALAESPSVARVVSVEGATVTLEVVNGSFVNGDQLELFSGAKKSIVTLKLPSTIDLLMKGDKVPGVTLQGGAAVVGAVVAPKGAFSSAAAATAAVPGSSAPPPAAPAPAAFKDSTVGCVYTPAELSRGLGFTVGDGKGTEIAFTGGTSYSCTWNETKGLRSVIVNRQVMSGGDPVANRAGMRKMLAGRLEDVPGDPDHAAWQVDQGDLTHVTLHYFRANTGTELRVMGVDRKDRSAVEAMRRKVLALPRR